MGIYSVIMMSARLSPAREALTKLASCQGTLLAVTLQLVLVCWARSNAPAGYLGCFVDRNDDRALQTDVLKYDYLTIEWCFMHCSSRGYIYAGLEFGEECFCGSNSDYDRHGLRSDSECQDLCTGNPVQICGDSRRISIYKISQGSCANPQNLQHTFSPSTNLHSRKLLGTHVVFTFTCDYGFFFDGATTIECISSENVASWNYPEPFCQKCTFIENCVRQDERRVRCTTSTDQTCDQCDGDYGPNSGQAYRISDDRTQCIKQCSWRNDSNACYPGNCMDAQCICDSGFYGADCTTMDVSQAPVLLGYSGTLIVGTTMLESPAVNGGTDTVYTNVKNFTDININWKCSYGYVIPNDIPSVSAIPYINSFNRGVVSAKANVVVNRAQGGSYFIASWNCPQAGSSDNPATALVDCTATSTIDNRLWTPATGDVLQYEVHSTSGGNLKLFDRDHSSNIITRYYSGQTTSGYSNFTFDFIDPYHCVDVDASSGCRTSMLNAGSDVTSEAKIFIFWSGWADDLAGIKAYDLQVRQLSGRYGYGMTEIFDSPPVYSNVTNSGQLVMLPHSGVYSIVLTVIDNAGNYKLSRRFVFFDDDPDDVTINSNGSLRLLSATEEADYEWLTSLNSNVGSTSVVLDWKNRFINMHHLNQGLLKPIGNYVGAAIDSSYDQNFGRRGRAAIPNVLGVTEFRVFHDIDHNGGRTIVNVSDDNSANWRNEVIKTRATYNLTLIDGDSIRFWVEARDVAGHFMRDSVLVHVDSSPPIVGYFRQIPGLSGTSLECRTFDKHSGIKTIEWRLFSNDTGPEIEHSYQVMKPIKTEEDSADCDADSCVCAPNGNCYITDYSPTFHIPDDDYDYFVTLTVTNLPGLVTSKTDKVNGMVTQDNVDQVANSLVSLTNDTSAIDDGALNTTADILDSIVNTQDTSPEITRSVVMVVSNLLQINKESFVATESTSSSSSRIIQALEKQITNALSAGQNISVATKNVVVTAMTFDPESLAGGLAFAAFARGYETDSLAGLDVNIHLGSQSEKGQTEASIELPEEILEAFSSGGGPVPISFILYQNDNLFSSQQTGESRSTDSSSFIDGRIISASVLNGTVKNLPSDSPVVISFLLDHIIDLNDTLEQNESCVFWDFSLRDGVGDWSTAGCRRESSVQGRVVCHCDHTTNFAVLVNIHGKKYASFALSIISKIGCGVSIVALCITIFIYSAMRSLRVKTPSRILISFCVSLLSLYVIFLVGVERTSSGAGCIIVAVLLHYFALTSMAWMGVEGVNLYLKLVKVLNADVEHFMVKASILAWGFPLLIIAVILGVDYRAYENEQSCFLKRGDAFYYGQLLIIGLVLLFNAVIFVLVLRQLTCKASKIQSSSTGSKRSKITRRLQNMVAVSVLLGLTWAFGLLSVFESATLVFQAIFSVLNSLQGLFIFLLFVVRHDKIREYVCHVIHRKRAADLSTSMSKGELTLNTHQDRSLLADSQLRLKHIKTDTETTFSSSHRINDEKM